MEKVVLTLFGLGIVIAIVKIWNHPSVINDNPEGGSWITHFFGDSGSDGADGGDGDCDGGDGGCD